MECLTYEKLYSICVGIHDELYKKQKYVEEIWDYIEGNKVPKIIYKNMKMDNITNEMILIHQIYKLAVKYKRKHINVCVKHDITDDIEVMIYQFELFIMLINVTKKTNFDIHEFFTYYLTKIDEIVNYIDPHHRVALSKYMQQAFEYNSINEDFIACGNYMSPVLFYYENKLCKIRANKEDIFDNEIYMYEIMQKQSNNFALYINKCPEFFTMHWDTTLQPFIYFDYNKQYLDSVLQVFDNLRRMKFYHGDLKCNNVMINISSLEIQIIDLEHSRILQDKNKVTWNDVVIDYFDRTNNCYCDEIVYFSNRIMELYDMYKFVISLCYNFDIIWKDYKYVKGIMYMDFLVFSMLCSNDEVQYVTSIIDMKDLFVCPCTKKELQNHYNEIKMIIKKEVIRNEP